jgi:hypothetical protein
MTPPPQAAQPTGIIGPWPAVAAEDEAAGGIGKLGAANCMLCALAEVVTPRTAVTARRIHLGFANHFVSFNPVPVIPWILRIGSAPQSRPWRMFRHTRVGSNCQGLQDAGSHRRGRIH